MATRYSGTAKIVMTYRRGSYWATVSERGKRIWSGTVHRSDIRGYGDVDSWTSPSAYDRVAHAALGYANDVEGVTVGTSAVRRHAASRRRRRPVTPFGARRR